MLTQRYPDQQGPLNSKTYNSLRHLNPPDPRHPRSIVSQIEFANIIRNVSSIGLTALSVCWQKLKVFYQTCLHKEVTTVLQTMRDKLDYLVQATGRAEAEIVAEAIEERITELYRKQIADAYIAGELDREQAISELGEQTVEDLDYARRAVEQDVQWGLKGE
jgi:predicted DNA-binding protein